MQILNFLPTLSFLIWLKIYKDMVMVSKQWQTLFLFLKSPLLAIAVPE